MRYELALLALLYLYFLITDSVPLLGWGLVALVWLARLWTSGTLTRTSRYDLPILLLILLLPASLWVSVDSWQSLPKANGLVLSAAFYYAVLNHISSRRDLAWATLLLILGSIAIAIAGLLGTDWTMGRLAAVGALYEHLPRLIQGLPRSIAGGFARNGVGGTLTLTVPLLFSLLVATGSLLTSFQGLARLHRWLVGAALVLSLVTLVLTQSRGALLGTAVGLAAVALLRDRRVMWIGWGVAAVAVLLLLAGYGMVFVDWLLKMDAGNGTLASRLEVWQRGILMVQDFPYTGIGIGTFNSIAHSLYPFFIAAPDEVVAHAHNTLLQVAVDLGLPALVAFAGLLTAFAISTAKLYRQSTDAATGALIAGLGTGMLAHQVFGLTDAFMLGTKPGVLLWVFIALVAAVERIPREICSPAVNSA